MKEVPSSYNAIGKAEISHKLRNLAEVSFGKRPERKLLEIAKDITKTLTNYQCPLIFR